MSEYINNTTLRRERLKQLILQLHAGADLVTVKQAFAAEFGEVSAGEIAAMEQALIQEGLPAESVQALCDVHVAVFRDALEQQAAPETIPGHPVFTLRAENLAMQRVLDALEAALKTYQDGLTQPGLEALRSAVAKLLRFELHYLRKEYLLFPALERHGFSGPSKVMWGIHDQIRAQWKALKALVDAEVPPAPHAVAALLAPMAQAMREMVYKEEHILFPAALERLTEQEWADIRDHEAEIGFAYVLPGKQWQPRLDPRTREAQAAVPDGGAARPGSATTPGLIPLEIGALAADIINLILKTLPLDVTYVDEEDTVRYFSQGAERIFLRTPDVVGRKVQNCHPPASVQRVQRILDDFRAGRRDVAEFWIQMRGKFVHIRYFALRDADGRYRGTLEVTQDLTPLRALQGEKRLLDD